MYWIMDITYPCLVTSQVDRFQLILTIGRWWKRDRRGYFQLISVSIKQTIKSFIRGNWKGGQRDSREPETKDTKQYLGVGHESGFVLELYFQLPPPWSQMPLEEKRKKKKRKKTTQSPSATVCSHSWEPFWFVLAATHRLERGVVCFCVLFYLI